MCDSQCLLQVSSEKHEHFFRLEGRDKSRSRLHWAQNTAYHDFSGDFRSRSSVWLDGSAKRLGDGSIQSWLPKFKVAMHRSTRSQSTCGTVFDQKKRILMLFWIFIHEKVQLTCPYGYHLWPESSTDHSNLIVLVGSGLCLCKAKLGQHSDDLNLGRIFCDFWQLFSSSKGWSPRLTFSARPAGT